METAGNYTGRGLPLLLIRGDHVPRQRIDNDNQETMGARLRRARTASGYSQEGLAREAGTSQRMVAYYETHAQKIPGHLLIAFSRVLGVSVDALAGARPLKVARVSADSRLWRKLRLVETFPSRDRRHVLQIIETIAERNLLRNKRGTVVPEES